MANPMSMFTSMEKSRMLKRLYRQQTESAKLEGDADAVANAKQIWGSLKDDNDCPQELKDEAKTTYYAIIKTSLRNIKAHT